ncbi:MAG: thioesterase domain-containing protein [Nakamurella sp.]
MTAGTATAWFARPVRTPALVAGAVPVLCLPYAGGGASAFRGWAEAFAPQVDIRPVQLPGRESRWAEEPEIDPGALAAAISETVTGDYLIYGHSMGARLGYETVRSLAATGGPLPRRLVIGGSPPPDLRLDGDLKDLSRRSDEEMITRLARLGGMPQEVLDSPELIELLLPAIRADFTWIDDYRWEPGPALPIPVTAVCGRRDGVCLPWTGLGWARHSAPGFRLRTMPGGHFFLHEQFGLLGGLLRAETADTVRPASTVRPGEVHLLLADLDTIDDGELAGLADQLAPEEHDRAARFVDPRDARRFTARRGIAREVLSRFGSQYSRAPLPTGAHGKPELPDGPQVSWSHRDGRLLLAAAAVPLGVDHETEHALPDTAQLATSILHSDELVRLADVPEQEHSRELLRAWTAKEAVLKCTGQGLAVEPTSLGLQQQDEHAGIIGADDHRQPAVLQVTSAPAALGVPAPEVVVVQLRTGPGAVATEHMFHDWSADEWIASADTRTGERR